MAKGQLYVLAGVDIGTHKTKVAVVTAGGRRPALAGAIALPSVGLEKGVIVDSGACAGVVGRALGEAVKRARVKLCGAWVSYNGAGTAVRECSGLPPFAGGQGGFDASWPPLPGEEVTLCFYSPRRWPNIGEDDDGLLKVVAAPKEHIKRIVECVGAAGLEVQGVLYSPLATARAVLTPAEWELGTLLVEVGAWSTTVSIFDRGSLRETAVVPVGGEHLVCDLAIGLRISLAAAAKVLHDIEEGSLTEGSAGFNVSLAWKILRPRINEMGEIIFAAYKEFSYPGLLPGGVVLCGGVSRLQELARVLQSFFAMPVRCGEIKGLFGLKPGLEDFSCAVGLALSGLRRKYLSGKI